MSIESNTQDHAAVLKSAVQALERDGYRAIVIGMTADGDLHWDYSDVGHIVLLGMVDTVKLLAEVQIARAIPGVEG